MRIILSSIPYHCQKWNWSLEKSAIKSTVYIINDAKQKRYDFRSWNFSTEWDQAVCLKQKYEKIAFKIKVMILLVAIFEVIYFKDFLKTLYKKIIC